jgi:flavin-binding protein dodecin
MLEQAHGTGATTSSASVIELFGTSSSSLVDAVRNAVQGVSVPLGDIQAIEMVSSDSVVGDQGQLALYRVCCKVSVARRPRGGAEPLAATA